MICLAPAGVSGHVRGIRELRCDAQGEMMARKDLEKETERPRYYSQFWLDVAAGRRVIGVTRICECQLTATNLNTGSLGMGTR